MAIIDRLKHKLEKRVFNFRCKRVFQTSPVICDPNSRLVVLSQLHHPDMTMYLLAAKSFARYVSVGRFVIVDDGLTEADRASLQHHLGNVEFVLSVSARREGLPAGGCWERLSTIVEKNANAYVVQLDSDTLTIKSPDEVISAVDDDVSFTLGTPTGTEIISARRAAELASKDSEHVQACAERVIDRVEVYNEPKYVRGCAGFAGFSAGRLGLDEVKHFTKNMEFLLGKEKWAEWGSEQVTSNFLIANTPGATVLPVSTYPFWAPNINPVNTKLLHFFGTYRFYGGMYTQLARAVIRELS